MDWLPIIAAVGGGGAVTAVGGVIVAIIQNGGKKAIAENTRHDQLQEDLKEERAANTVYRARVDLLEKLVVNYQRRDVAWYRYVSIIKTGVERGEQPPWAELTGILREEPSDE